MAIVVVEGHLSYWQQIYGYWWNIWRVICEGIQICFGLWG